MSNIVIGSTARVADIAQSRRGDFRQIMTFINVDAVTGAETDTDLTGCSFTMEIFALDGTSLEVLEVGTGITVVDNVVTILIPLATYSTWTRGCKYPYYITYTDADDFTKCLFEGSFILS